MTLHQRHGLVGRSAASLTISELILLAALECFVEKGYYGTPVRDIANRADISVPGLYHHFPSKMALLEKLMDETMDDLLTHVGGALNRARPDPLARFEAVIEAHVEFHCERPEESFVGNSELRSLTPEFRQSLIGKRDGVQSYFETVVNEGIDAGIFDVERPHETARALASMCVAVASWYQRGGPLSADDVVAIYRDLGLQLVGFDRRPAAKAQR